MLTYYPGPVFYLKYIIAQAKGEKVFHAPENCPALPTPPTPHHSNDEWSVP